MGGNIWSWFRHMIVITEGEIILDKFWAGVLRYENRYSFLVG